jgi:peptidoglycan hydrolase-like amidase
VIRVRLRAATSALLATLLLAGGVVSAHEALTAGPAAADTTFTFDGGGWGHAVGMSQWGAKGRADAGQSAATIIGAYYTGTQLTAVAQPGVRVHLADTASTTIAFTAASTISGNGGPLASIAAGETVEIKAVGAAFQLQVIAPAVKAVVALAANDTVTAPLNGAPARVSATGNRYNNGRLVIRLSAAGSLQVVNDSLTMQQYLYGLAEVPSSWPLEALKSQALAARTYAFKKVQSPRSANYDLLSITYTGAAIDALYSSSNGGYSEDSEYAFVSALPYLRANADPFDNTPGNVNFRWSRSYSGAELGQYMLAYRSVDIGVVTSYEVSSALSRVGRIDRANVKLVGTKGTQTLTGAQFRTMINQSAPSNRQLQSTLLFFRPIGSFDAVSIAPGIVNISGWALFQGSATPAFAHVYVNDRFAGGVEATTPRPDVAATVPGASTNVGYSVPVAVDRAVNTICAYAVAPTGSTGSTLLGCRTVTVDTQPFGSLDSAVATPGGLRVSGWAMDPNNAGSGDVHVYINGAMAGSIRAGNSRGDLAAVFPAYGAAHGFDATFPVDAAINTACAYAINVGPGDNQLLGCRTVVNSVQPFGAIDLAVGTSDGVVISGWAIDPDSSQSIDVHVYVDNVGTVLTADGSRPDLASVFPGFGTAHGYRATISASPGTHTVCAYAINVRAGANQQIGCRTVFIPADPFGSVDVVRAGADGVRVSGWAIDPNTSNPIEVHVYVGTSGTPVLADRDRPDIAAAYPSAGAKHGFDTVVPGRAGQTVCVYAINAGPGATQTLACRIATA